MKTAWLIPLLLMCCANIVLAQKNRCDCEVFLSTEYTWEEHVYEQPDKKTELYMVGNNAMDEDFIHFAIQAQKGKMLQVAPYGIHKWYGIGWIENNHISVYGRNYVEPIPIYKKDDTASSVVFRVPVGFEPEYHVTGCNGKWLQVELLYDDKQIKGWLAPDDQCGSAYTNCN